jgi:hypothetical protein
VEETEALQELDHLLRLTGVYVPPAGSSDPMEVQACCLVSTAGLDVVFPETGRIRYSLVGGLRGTGGVDIGADSEGNPRPVHNPCVQPESLTSDPQPR